MIKPYYQDDYCTIPKSTRSWLRKRGVQIPKLKPGPKKGYKQSLQHIEKRKMLGENHPCWKGCFVSIKGGRSRALRLYPKIGSCVICGEKKTERHHIDGNTFNNDLENISILCRKCHMKEDGRLDKFREISRINQPKALAARWNNLVL